MGVVVFTKSANLQSHQVRGPFGSLDFKNLLVLGPLQKLLLLPWFLGMTKNELSLECASPKMFECNFIIFCTPLDYSIFSLLFFCKAKTNL